MYFVSGACVFSSERDLTMETEKQCFKRVCFKNNPYKSNQVVFNG